MNKKILAALSGGVDSAVTALVLKKEGYDVSGATLVLCDGPENEAKDAQELCEKLGIPHRVLDRKALFRKTVIKDFCESYARGETPNPCTACNPAIKFGELIKIADDEGFDLVATGHYAICFFSEKYGRFVIKKAENPKKDQSYVLWGLDKEILSKIIFPLGKLDKQDTRAIAEAEGLASAHKKDSQDICFIKDIDYAGFVEDFLGKKFDGGDFVTPDGKVLGRHRGIIRYTEGQRKGLGLSLPAPLYVKKKDVVKNQVVLAPENEIFSRSLYAEKINMQAVSEKDFPLRAFCKTRYSAKEVPCTASFCGDKVKIEFDQPVRAVTRGQSAVLYDDCGILLMGAVICDVE